MTFYISVPAAPRTYWTMVALALGSYAAARLADSDALGLVVLAGLLSAAWLLGRSSVSLLDEAIVLRPWGYLGFGRVVPLDHLVTARSTVIDEDPRLDVLFEEERVTLGPWQPFFREELLARVEQTAEAVRTHRIRSVMQGGRMPLHSP